MRLFDWLRYIPLSWGQYYNLMGRIKDILLDPVNSTAELLRKILQKQGYLLQRIVAVIVLIFALFFGVDIGIDYQKNLIPQSIEINIPEVKTEIEIEKPIEEKIDDTYHVPEQKIEPKTKIQILKTIKNIPKHKSVPKQIKTKTEIYRGPFNLGSSGPGGY